MFFGFLRCFFIIDLYICRIINKTKQNTLNSINDDSDGVVKVSKKIDKYLNNVQDLMKNSQNENSSENNITYDNLYQQYNYFNNMLKSSIFLNNNLNNSEALKESQIALKNMQNINLKYEYFGRE